MGAMAIPLAIGSAALQGTAAFGAARAQNQAIRRTSDAIVRNTQTQQDQLVASTNLQRQQLSRQAQVAKQQRMAELAMARGRLRATGGSLGVGSLNGIQLAASAAAGRDLSLIDENRFNQQLMLNSQQTAGITNIRSQAEAGLIDASARYRSPIVGGLTGGLGGFAQGLNIGRAIG